MNEVQRGESIRLQTDSGERRFRVSATYQSFDISASAVLISRDRYDRYFHDRNVDGIGLYIANGVTVERVIADLEAVADGKQQIVINSNARIRELSLEIFDRTFTITNVLYWLALGVAFIGILGAMLALQLERAREFATLRALGMTPAQLGAMVTTQTGTMGFLSGLAAIPLGVIMAWVLIEVINRRAFGWQIGAALLAGIYPAYRSSQVSPASAMREE
jgi:putative ABC transport system permease protein